MGAIKNLCIDDDDKEKLSEIFKKDEDKENNNKMEKFPWEDEDDDSELEWWQK